jgi:hypothetical protein
VLYLLVLNIFEHKVLEYLLASKLSVHKYIRAAPAAVFQPSLGYVLLE